MCFSAGVIESGDILENLEEWSGPHGVCLRWGRDPLDMGWARPDVVSLLPPSFLHHIFLTCQQNLEPETLVRLLLFPVVARRHRGCLGTASPAQACVSEQLSLCCLF